MNINITTRLPRKGVQYPCCSADIVIPPCPAHACSATKASVFRIFVGLCSDDDCGAVNCCDEALATLDDAELLFRIAS